MPLTADKRMAAYNEFKEQVLVRRKGNPGLGRGVLQKAFVDIERALATIVANVDAALDPEPLAALTNRHKLEIVRAILEQM
jgi:hypothetical protein